MGKGKNGGFMMLDTVFLGIHPLLSSEEFNLCSMRQFPTLKALDNKLTDCMM